MSNTYPAIEGRLREFIESQHVFFVATAPLAPGGRVNVSPKGINGTFCVVDDHMVAYLATGLLDYRRLKNRVSIDGLSAFDDDPQR